MYQGREIPETATDMCPWLDLRQPPIEVLNELLEATTERRQIKTHLRLDALKFNSKAKYVYLARDGRDTYISFCNHYKNQKDVLYQMMNESPGKTDYFEQQFSLPSRLRSCWTTMSSLG